MNLLGALVPYMVLALSLFGTGQQAVQRFLSCRDLASARRAALTGWVAGTVTLGLTLFLGVVLGAWLSLAPAARGLVAEKGDAVLPLFIGARLPAGLEGLMLAAIFAASMSSLDSAIHSISTAVIVDFQRRFSRRERNVRAELRLARVVTACVGVLATIGALYAAERSALILETLITWLGYFAGPLLGLFLLGMLTRGVTERGALTGVGAAFAGIVALLTFTGGPRSFGFHPLWIAPASLAVTLAVGMVASALPWRHAAREPA
jgi:SSS family solute:Na+ symporter